MRWIVMLSLLAFAGICFWYAFRKTKSEDELQEDFFKDYFGDKPDDKP